MDGRPGAYSGGEGYSTWSTTDPTDYDSYNYSYDFGQSSSSSYDYTGKSWQTSYLTHSSDRATHAGHFQDGSDGHFMTSGSSYDGASHFKYGYTDPNVQYGNKRERPFSFPSHRALAGNPSGCLKGSLGGPAGARGFGHPPPLFTPGQYPDLTGHHGLRAFTGSSYFGGGFKQRTKRNRKGQKMSVRGGGPPPEKREKKAMGTEGPQTKSEDSESEGDEEADMVQKSTKTDFENKESDGKAVVAAEIGTKEKAAPDKRQQVLQNRRLRDRMADRIQFICSLCKFRTFYDEEMTQHLESDFHKEHICYLQSKLPKQIADFLEEYVTQKRKKTDERRQVITDLGSTIQKIYRDQDLTQELGMEHFVKKVDAAHCAACDILIPMRSAVLQQHLKSAMHIQNCKNMMEQSKKCGLAVARSILNNKAISEKLDRYVKGENPFLDDHNKNLDGGNNVDMSTAVPRCVVEERTLDLSTEEKTDCSLAESKPLETDIVTAEDIHPSEVPKSTMEQEGMIDASIITLTQGDTVEVSGSTAKENESVETLLSEASTDTQNAESLSKEDHV